MKKTARIRKAVRKIKGRRLFIILSIHNEKRIRKQLDIICILWLYTCVGKKQPDLSKVVGFDWDEGNLNKNWEKHRVRNREAMEVFSNKPLKLFFDTKHSRREDRGAALGKTDANRQLTIIFTIREQKIRVISARDQDKKERKIYGQK